MNKTCINPSPLRLNSPPTFTLVIFSPNSCYLFSSFILLIILLSLFYLLFFSCSACSFLPPPPFHSASFLVSFPFAVPLLPPSPLFLLYHCVHPLLFTSSSSSSFSSPSFPRGEPMCASCCSKGSAGVDRAGLTGMSYTVRVCVCVHI